MMGSIEPSVRQGLIRATLHLVNREYELLAEDFVTLGFLPRGSDMDAVIPALTGKPPALATYLPAMALFLLAIAVFLPASAMFLSGIAMSAPASYTQFGRYAALRALHLVKREYELPAEDFLALGLLPLGRDMDAVIPALTGESA
jgi:hypothetical protein